METLVLDTLSMVKHKPFGELAEKLLYKLGKAVLFPCFFYDHFYIFEYDLTKHRVKRELPWFVIRPGTTDDLPGLCALTGKKREELAQRFARGHLCIVAARGGALAGVTWVELGDRHREDVTEHCFKLHNRGAWAYDSFIAPQHRQSGIWRRLVDEAARHLKQKDLRTLYCNSSRLNRTSVLAHLRYGYTFKREVLYFRAFNLRTHVERDIAGREDAGTWQARVRFSKNAFVTTPPPY